ncbi:MAG: EAL domain-containing protein [Pseudomonadota bacterium]
MRKILFVDDDPLFLDSTKRLLHKQSNKWDMFFATSVKKALEIIEENEFDTIISDIKMPGETGFDLLNSLQTNKNTQSIPVIMLTGALENDLKLKALEIGATDLLNKPVNQVDLLARINSCLKLKAYHDEIVLQNLSLEKKVKEQIQQALLAAEISSILVQKKDLQSLLQQCTEAIVKYLDAAFARIWVFDEKINILELMASAGMYTNIKGAHQFTPLGQFKVGIIAQEKKPHLTNEVIGDPQISDQNWAKQEGMVSFAGYPLIVENRLVGVMAMFSKKPLYESILNAMASISDKIALGIEWKKSEDKVHLLAFYDSLTDLPNRHFFYEFIKKTIQYASRYQQVFALAFIDLDNFSRVNKSLGHNIGDECLKIVSARVANVLRKSDCVARFPKEEVHLIRMGGDHFTVLLHDINNICKVSHIAKRILNELSKVYNLDGHEVYLTASIGIAVYPEDGNDVDVLFKNAEAALDDVKKKGKNNFGFYSDSMNESALELLDFETDLRKAIDQQEFIVYYQPKVDLVTRKIIGMEALVRWRKPDGTLVPPIKFIPLAETNGLIIPIGNFVLETACNQNKKWMVAGMRKIGVAVNASGEQFGQKDFVQTVLSALKKTKLDPKYLELEITETTIMVDPERAIRNLNELKRNGIKISLDDFGTGYSSLGYLQKLPLDALKIDISFIRNILTNPNDAVIVKTIIAMAHNLSLTVIAEGVEDERQLEFLRKHNCDTIQGYLFSPPVPAEDFPDLLKTF